jgi:hypothetical protein
MRARVEGQEERRKYVTAVGASVMGRMMEEVERIGEQVLMMGPTVRIKGEWKEDKLMKVMEDLEKCEVEPDYILVFGPGNEMVVHGKTEGRGTGGEKKLIMEGEGRIRVEFHLTEPARRTTRDKEHLVNMVYGLMRGIRKMCGGSKVVYVGLFPRHVEQCCREEGHMRAEDVTMMHGGRKEFDEAVKGKIGEEFECWDWHEVLGLKNEPTLREIRERRVVSRDGVHLEKSWNRRAAAQICCRIAEGAVMVVGGGEGGEKRGG